MKKSYLYLGGFFLVVAGVVMFFIEKGSFVSDTETGDIQMETYVRNITWDTDYQAETPYNKGEKIEKVFVFKNRSSKPIDLRLKQTALVGNLENAKIVVDNNSGSIDEVNVAPEQAILVSVEGVTHQSSMTFSLEDSREGTKKQEVPQSFVDILPDQVSVNTGSAGGSSTTPVGQTQSSSGNSQPPSSESEFKILRVIGNNFYSNTDNALRIDVSDTEKISSVLIGEKSFVPLKSASGTILVNIEKGTFMNGKYFLALMLNSGNLVSAKEGIVFLKPENSISVSNITPTKIKNDIARFIVIQGMNLKNVVSVQLSNNVILTRTDFVPINNQVMGVKIPDHLAPGTYHLSIMDLKNIYEFGEKTFQIY